MINITPHRKILTQNLYNGEKALKRFNAEFPYICSNMKYQYLIKKHKDNERFVKVIPQLSRKAVLSGLTIFQMRNLYEEAPDKLMFLKNAVKNTKMAGCQECSILMHDTLKKSGIPSQNVRLYIEKKNGFDTDRNHAFTVIGMDKNADITKPKTWGKNAVIVDGWANIVKRVQDGLEYFKGIIKYNPEEEVCKFESHRNI